jgi:cyanophycinase
MPEEMNKTYKKAFANIGYRDVGFIKIENKEDARKTSCCERIKKSHAVFFTGGDQFSLSAILGGTDTIRAIKSRYYNDPHFVVAGTSAGAMAMPKIMIYEGGVNEALLKGDLKMSSGLGVLDSCIIDTHFIKRGRFGRLANAIVMNPDSLGIGLGEDTAMIIKNGFKAECRGSGTIIIIDGNGIGQTNITDTDSDAPIFIENLRVHILTDGCRFSLTERKMVTPAKKRVRKAHAV